MEWNGVVTEWNGGSCAEWNGVGAEWNEMELLPNGMEGVVLNGMEWSWC